MTIMVKDGDKFVFDENAFSVPIVAMDLNWIYGIQFLRRVALRVL